MGSSFDDDGDPYDHAGGGRTARAQAETRTERIRMVDRLLRACLAHGTIERLLSKDWEVSPRQVRKYIRAAYRLWADDAKRCRVEARTLRRAQLEGVLETSMHTVDPHTLRPKPDLKSAVMALHRLNLIDGVYEPTKVEISGKQSVEEMRGSDRNGEITKLLKAYEERVGHPVVVGSSDEEH
jgi:hypothetical protein